MKSGAVLSTEREYRYMLWREWDIDLPRCNFIMLNPSTANENEDDPTIRRVINYCKAWGYGAVCVTNLFALRATNPKELKEHDDPVGEFNDDIIIECASESDLVVCAWGNNGSLMKRSSAVRCILYCLLDGRDLHCLKKSKTDEPVHPLYQKKDLKPVVLL